MRLDTFLRHRRSLLTLVNQSPFLLISLTLLHLSRGFLPIFHFLALWLAAVLGIVGIQLTIMDSQMNQAPDLASILRTLASYTPTQAYPQPQQLPLPIPQQAEVHRERDLEEGEYDPNEYDPTSYDPPPPPTTSSYPQQPIPQPPPLWDQQPPPPLSTPHQPLAPQQHPSIPQPPSKKPPPPTPSPTSITTWPPALRHVTTLTTTTPSFTHRIRHLIHTQHTHERQWWASRLSLLQTLSSRDEKKRKLDSVLTSIGGKAGGASTTSDLSPEKELEIFDRKVYRACKQMVAATSEELRRLEVPFFCTRGTLVGMMGTGGVGEEELVRLQGKMVELLEDLCGDEEVGGG